MHTGKGQILELILQDGFRLARVSCAANLIPTPGQYLLASDASDATLSLSKRSPLPVPLFYTDSAPAGFLSSPPIPESWMPGMDVFLRGPLGHGFTIPVSARKVGLIAFDDSPSRLRGLIRPSLSQGAAVVLVTDSIVDNLPDEVEALPLSALSEIIEWADYLAFDVARENLFELQERLRALKQVEGWSEAQARVERSRNVLIRTPVPCGGVAECGVCAVSLKSSWKMACKDGPVFDLREI